jgi:hypothetical protein
MTHNHGLKEDTLAETLGSLWPTLQLLLHLAVTQSHFESVEEQGRSGLHPSLSYQKMAWKAENITFLGKRNRSFSKRHTRTTQGGQQQWVWPSALSLTLFLMFHLFLKHISTLATFLLLWTMFMKEWIRAPQDMGLLIHECYHISYFLLDIFFIYISNAILIVPYTLPPPCFPTHPLPLPGPGIPLYWGI